MSPLRLDPPNPSPLPHHGESPSLSLRPALIHDWLTGRRGGEKCLEQLALLFPHAPIYTLLHQAGSAGPILEAREIRTSWLQKIPSVSRRYRGLLPLMPMAVRSWRLKPGEFDVVISFSHCVAKAVRVPEGVPHLCYCFTPMRYAWDARAEYLASIAHPLKRAVASRVLDRLKDWDRATATGVTRFLALSRTVQDRIARHYKRDALILPPPVDTRFYTLSHNPDWPRERFYLCVSALVPYKRIDLAIQACNRLKRRLIVIGDGPEAAKLRALAGPTIHFLGWVDDTVIRDHYRRAFALIFPGEEDFGIVPIEALACGCPVIALNRGAVPETVDDTVGLRFEEPKPDALAEALLAFEARPPIDSRAARRKAEPFAVERFTQRFLEVLRQTVAAPLTLKDNASSHTGSIPHPHLGSSPRAGSVETAANPLQFNPSSYS